MENILTIAQQTPWVIPVIVIWCIVWKAIAFWHAARNNQLAWYIALFIINTLGVLEIIYLFFFAKKNNSNQVN